MKTLADLGFVIGADEAHQQRIRPEEFVSEEFFAYAKPLLRELNEIVCADVIPHLERYSGRWHPLGFMIFPLGIHSTLGSLRLHIWPAGERVSIQGGSGIHDHGWCIASYVVAGVYSDERYRIEEVPAQTARDHKLPDGLLRIFQATKTPGQPDALTTDGTLARVEVTERMVLPMGNIHTIEPGAFHLPTIAVSQLASTLVLDSPSLGIKPRILISRDSTDPIYNPRPQITEDQALIAKRQILDAHS